MIRSFFVVIGFENYSNLTKQGSGGDYYLELPGGLLLQWGTFIVTGSINQAWGSGYVADITLSHNFVKSFSNAIYSIQLFPGSNAACSIVNSRYTNTTISNLTLFRAAVGASSLSYLINYIAIGI